MNTYIRKILAAGLCLATVTLCAPAQITYAAPTEIVTTDNTEPASPTGFKAPVLTAEAIGYNWVTISWEEVDQAVSYELQQSVDKKNYTTVATFTAGQTMSYTAKDLYTKQNYFYRIFATNEAGETVDSARLKVKPALGAPTVTKMEASGSDKIDLAWTAVEGADFYRVYRSTTKTGGYKSVKTVYGTSYTNTVAAGVTYYYKIMPLRYNPDGKKIRGKCSTPQSIAVKMDAPVITGVTNSGGNSLTVSWSGVANATGYGVYRSTEKSSGYKLVKELGGNTYSWTDTTVEAGTIYYYKVSACTTTNGANSYGSKSAAKSKWTKSDAPSDMTAVQDGSGGVQLSWTATKGTTSYTIYRADGDSSVYNKIASNITACTYTDSGLAAGESYSYKIEAVHGSLVSDKSNAVTIKIGAIKVNTRTLFLGPDVSKKLTATSELPGTIVWSSENPGIAKVGADGTVTGVAPGTTTVIAEVGGAATSVAVTVTDCKINGIDVSKWQQAIDWKTVKDSGIQFAMLRLTYGTSVDIQFENYYAGAMEQGIDVGVYCYTRAKNVEEGIEEAEYLVELLGGRELAYPVALDIEDDLQIKNMNKAMRTELILEYKRIIEEAGYEFVVYANLNWLNNYIDQDKLEEEDVDIWIARYRSQSLGHGYEGGGNVRIWQYSSTGQVDGILDAFGRYINVDLDVCYEDY